MSKPIILFIVFLGVVLIGIFLIWPEYQKLTNLQVQVKEKKEELKAKEQYIAMLRNAVEEFKKYDAEIAKINSALPSDPDLPSLFEFLQKTSSQNGLILKGLGGFLTASDGQNPNMKETRLDFSVSGPYPSFKNFLASLEKSSRLIDVESINLLSEGGETLAYKSPEGATFSFGLNIKVHSY